MTAVIKVNGLVKGYEKQPVLTDINLKVTKGEVFVLLGKNGAGKSSLFKLLVGMNQPTAGTIEVLERVSDLEKNITKIGFNINEAVFYEHLSARENLGIHCGYMACSPAGIASQLTTVGLDPENPAAVKTYSSGMRQRLALARCLVHDPELLIIDEPLNGLDPKGIRDFRELIQDLAASGKTIVMSSHILSEVMQVATRIAVLAAGQVVLNDTLSNLKEAFGADFENRLILKMEGN